MLLASFYELESIAEEWNSYKIQEFYFIPSQ